MLRKSDGALSNCAGVSVKVAAKVSAGTSSSGCGFASTCRYGFARYAMQWHGYCAIQILCWRLLCVVKAVTKPTAGKHHTKKTGDARQPKKLQIQHTSAMRHLHLPTPPCSDHHNYNESQGEREREIGGGGLERDCPGRDLAMQAPWLEGDAAPNQNSCFFHCMSPLKKRISTISAAEPCAAVASTRGVEIGQEHEEKGGWADAGGRWRMATQRKKEHAER